jgi:3-phytase
MKARQASSPYLHADAEGLTIYRLQGSRGYLLASSQGSSTFLAYDLTSLNLLGTFEIGGGPTDHVDDSDCAMVVNSPLNSTFSQGLLVTHDGNDEPFDDRDELQVHALAGRRRAARARDRHDEWRPVHSQRGHSLLKGAL